MSGEQIFDIDSIPDYSSYLHLLGNSPVQPEVNFDLIIVPQGRPPEAIERAATLAGAVGATLLSLCSHEAEADKVARVLTDMRGGPIGWYAVDVPPGYAIPGFELTAQQRIPDLCAKDPGWNLSDKRNIGMAIGRMIGARRIFFHDDDLRVWPDALRQVGLMLHKRNIAGLKCGGFPDKSVLMHAKNEILAFQANDPEFGIGSGRGASRRISAGQISANSMGVDPSRVLDHFPIIYNEDWLFAYYSIQRGLAGVGREIYKQDHYNPFITERIRGEEFGDLVIDGLYNRLNDKLRGRPTGDLSDAAYWQATIEARRRQYEALMRAVPARRNPEYLSYFMRDPRHLITMPEEQQAKLQTILAAGLEVNEALQGDQFVDYMYAWKEERVNWRQMAKQLPSDLAVDEALKRLDLGSYTLAA